MCPCILILRNALFSCIIKINLISLIFTMMLKKNLKIISTDYCNYLLCFLIIRIASSIKYISYKKNYQENLMGFNKDDGDTLIVIMAYQNFCTFDLVPIVLSHDDHCSLFLCSLIFHSFKICLIYIHLNDRLSVLPVLPSDISQL